MKKAALILLAALSLALTGKSQENFKNFDEFYQAIVELNPDYNLDSLVPGDIILLPDESREDTEIWEVDRLITDRTDFIFAVSQWLTRKANLEKIVAQPIPPLKQGWDWHNIWWLMFAFPVVWLLVREWRRRHLELSREQLGDMQHATPENIIQRINKSNPKKYEGRTMQIKRYMVIRNYGQNFILCRFKLGDGAIRRAYLKPGDIIAETISRKEGLDPIIEFWEARGGRNICLWPGEGFQLPDGWFMVPYASDQLEELKAIKDMAEEVKRKIEEQPGKFVQQQKEMIADIMKNLPPANEGLECEEIRFEFIPQFLNAGNTPPAIAWAMATRHYAQKQKTEPEA